MWVQKRSVEKLESPVEIGRWNLFADLNRHSRAFSCIEFRVTWIVTSAKLAVMHFMFRAVQINGFNLTHVKQLSSFLKEYPLLFIMLFLSLQDFCDIFQCPYHASKHKTIQSHTRADKDSRMFGDLADSYPGIVPCTFVEQLFLFQMSLRTWNACRSCTIL